MGGGDQAEVVDSGRGGLGAGGLGDGVVHVAAGDERDRLPGGLAVQPDVDLGEIFRVVPQLDAAPGERGINRVRVAFERDGRGAGHPAGHRPAERLGQQPRAGLAARSAGLKPPDRRLAGLGVPPAVGDIVCPGGEQVIQMVERLDAVVFGLGQERLPDIPVESFLLSPAFRLTGQSRLSLWITVPG